MCTLYLCYSKLFSINISVPCRAKARGLTIFSVIPQVAAQLGVTDYRIVSNNGADAGQTVQHLHFHLLAGRELGIMG